MIIEEIINDHRVKHYSDKGLKIRQVETGVIYNSAEDVLPCKYTYEETEEAIPERKEEKRGNVYGLKTLNSRQKQLPTGS